MTERKEKILQKARGGIFRVKLKCNFKLNLLKVNISLKNWGFLKIVVKFKKILI